MTGDLTGKPVLVILFDNLCDYSGLKYKIQYLRIN